MSRIRRRAALGLITAAAALPAARAFAQEPIEAAEEDAPDTAIATHESRNDHMMAPVSINGEGPFNFLLDTGANVSCVSHKLMQRLELKPGEMTRVHTVVGVSERPIVTLDLLKVGPRNRRKVRAPALPIKGNDVDGILGVDWLKGQRLVLDFKNQKMEIVRSKIDENEPGRVVVVPAKRRHGQLTIVDADLSGARISAIIDSGAQGTLCNRPLRDLVRRQEARKGRFEAPRYVRMESLAGEVFQGESLFLPFLRLGGLHLGNVPITYADMHVFDIWGLKDSPALVIGMDLLTQFEQVSLDFGHSNVRFDFT